MASLVVAILRSEIGKNHRKIMSLSNLPRVPSPAYYLHCFCNHYCFCCGCFCCCCCCCCCCCHESCVSYWKFFWYFFILIVSISFVVFVVVLQFTIHVSCRLCIWQENQKWEIWLLAQKQIGQSETSWQCDHWSLPGPKRLVLGFGLWKNLKYSLMCLLSITISVVSLISNLIDEFCSNSFIFPL